MYMYMYVCGICICVTHIHTHIHIYISNSCARHARRHARKYLSHAHTNTHTHALFVSAPLFPQSNKTLCIPWVVLIAQTGKGSVALGEIQKKKMVVCACALEENSWQSFSRVNWRAQAGTAERWGAGVKTQKNVRGEVGGWCRVPFNEPYAPLLSTIYNGA